jgi:hypothetical protein
MGNQGRILTNYKTGFRDYPQPQEREDPMVNSAAQWVESRSDLRLGLSRRSVDAARRFGKITMMLFN